MLLAPGPPLSASTAPDERSLEKLFAGVEEITAPGSPGSVCAFGDRAFVVLCGKGDVPVVVAAEVGKGRVLLLGHNGYLSADAIAKVDTGAFLKNCLRWLAGGKRKPSVACGGNKALADAFDELGLRSEPAAPLKDVDCLAFAPGALTAERSEEIAAFVEKGGGLLVAATGWGWQQLHPKQRLERDFDANRLLVPFGVAFGHDTVGKTSPNGFLAQPPPALAHAGYAYAALVAGTVDAKELAAVSMSVERAMASLPDHEPNWLAGLRRELESGSPAGQLDAVLAAYESREWRALGERWSSWLVVGPLRAGRDIASTGAPEKILAALQRGREPKLDASYKSKVGKATWVPLALDADGEELDVGEIRFTKVLPVEPDADPSWSEGALAYLYRTIESDRERVLPLQVGANDGLRLWCNGELVADRPNAVAVDAQDAHVLLNLRAGTNHLLAKVPNDEGVWSFHMRRASETVSRFSQVSVNDAIDLGIATLREEQLIDGSWGAFRNYQVGYTAYATYALLKCGVPRDAPVVRRAMNYVRAGDADFTYSLSCKILALCAYGAGERPTRELEGAVEQLLEWQHSTGLYAYPTHPGGGAHAPDLSNTLYAAMALRAAAEAGVVVPKRAWRGLGEGTLSCWELAREARGKRAQPRAAGFGYRAGQASTGSMTTAGLSILAIVQEQLGSSLDRQLKLDLDAALDSGRGWLERYLAFNENPGANRWHFFFLYGLERLGGLLGVRELGGSDWFEEGARYLAEAQDDDGSWKGEDGDRNAAQDTVLALLFLSRATAPRTGEAREPKASVSSTGGDLTVRATGSDPLDVWITGLSDAARERLGETRVEHVTYVLVRDGVEHVAAEVEPREGAPVQRFEARLELPAPGAYELIARASVAPANAEEGTGPVAVASEAVVVRSAANLRPETFAYALDRGRNLLLRKGVTFTPSSEAKNEVAARIADGEHTTRWLCASSDAVPSLRAQLPSPVSADRLIFSHAFPSTADRSRPQVARVAVEVDGDEYELELDPDPMFKTELVFAKPRRVSRIELRVLAVRGGSLGAGGFGFSELELVAGER